MQSNCNWKKSFTIVEAKIWQDIPNELKKCSFPVFKRKLKTHLVSNYLNSTWPNTFANYCDYFKSNYWNL